MLKKIGIIFAGLAIIFFLIALSAPYFINSDRLKGIVIGRIENNTGYKIAIGGDVDISVFPFARLTAKQVSVATKNNPKNPLLQIEELDVGLRLMPMLGGKIDINRFALEKPKLLLVKMERGNNWTGVNTKVAPNKAAAKPSKQVYSDIQFNEITINQGSVIYRDTVEKTDITLDKLNLSATMQAANLPLAINASMDWNKKPLSLKATIDSLETILSAQATKIDIVAQSDLAKATLKGNTNTLEYEGDVSLDTASIADLTSWLTGMPKPKDAKSQSLFLVGKADCSISKCGVSEMNLQFNGIKLGGSASLETEHSRPYITADLSTDTVDISTLLPPKKQAALSFINNAYAEGAIWSNSPYDLSFLDGIDGNLKLTTKQFIANQFKAQNLKLLAKIERGFLSAEANDVELYDGKASVIINLESSGKVDGRASFTNIALDPLLAGLSKDNRVAGNASGKLAFASLARSEVMLIENLGATGNIAIADGSIKGVDIAGMVRNLQSAYKEVDKTQQKTDFSEVSASYTITSGVIKNDDLMMKAPLFRVSGKGQVNLPLYNINYSLTPQIVETIQGQGGKEKDGLGVPILITGSLNNPNYAPDLQGLANEVLKDPKKVKETVKSIKDLIKKPKAAPAADGATAPETQPEKPMNQLKNLLKGI